MQRLSAVDNLFLWLERRQQPMHVAGLQVFRFPDDASAHYVGELAEYLRQFNHPTRPFDRYVAFGWKGIRWQHDDKFDIDHHFRHVALPKPGGPRELLSFVSSEHSNLLDRSRPLWECYLIEAMHGRHFALYTKMHHAMVDGVSAMRLGMRILSPSPDIGKQPPVWQLPPPGKQHRADEHGLMSQADAIAHLVRNEMKTIPAVTRALYSTIRHALSNRELAHVFTAPQCRLNQPISGSRRFAAQSVPVQRLRDIARKTGSTTNDVILAVCSSALRTYLRYYNELPEKPLVAMVPISLRKDDSAGGNQVAVILANLATHKDDPLQRLDIIRESVNEGKDRFQSMTQDQIINYTALTLAPTGLALFTGLMPQWLAFNVVISNVPGPQTPQYWNGALLERMYPVSAIVNHMALNITIISYNDSLEFGVVGCRRTLPSIQRLLTFMEYGLEELEDALGIVWKGSSKSPVVLSRKADLRT